MSYPVRLVSIRDGADFQIDLAAFPEQEPVFAYVDDLGSEVEALQGLVLDGTITVEGQPDFMWLRGSRRCVLLKALAAVRRSDLVSFRSLGVGEFCVEIYHVSLEGAVRLLHQDDFCFK